MTRNIEITATPDTAVLSTIHSACFPKGWTGAEIQEMLGIQGTVAAVGKEGFALVRLIAGEAELLTIAVMPGSRRSGMGRALLDSLVKWLKEQGAQCLFLEVRVGGEPAISLYRQVGFVEAGRRKGYYPLGDGSEDALLMRLPLYSR